MALSLSTVVVAVRHAVHGTAPASPNEEIRTLAGLDAACQRLASGTHQGALAWEHAGGAATDYHRLRANGHVYDVYATAGEAVLDVRTADGAFVTDHDGPAVETLLAAIRLRHGPS